MALQPQTSIAAHGLAVHSPHSPEQFSDGRIPEATLQYSMMVSFHLSP